MGDAIFKIPTPLMLSKIVDGISNLELSKDRDTKEICMSIYYPKWLQQVLMVNLGLQDT